MLTVKTKIGPSTIHGIGLFADQVIPKGTLVWTYARGLDVALTEEEYRALPEIARKNFKNYCYKSNTSNLYILPFDDARYFNHSDSPNTIEAPHTVDGEVSDMAARDIEPGEELLNNYHVTDADSAYKMSHDVRS